MRNLIRVELGKPPKHGKGGIKMPADWMLNYPREYVLPRFQIWFRSGFQVYPRTGGMDDQDQLLMEDFWLLLDEHDYQYQLREEWLEK